MDRNSAKRVGFSVQMIFTCDECGHVAYNELEMSAHVAEHYTSPDTDRPDSSTVHQVSNVSLSSSAKETSMEHDISAISSSIAAHKRRVQKSPTRFVCSVCNFEYKHEKNLMRHMQKVHSSIFSDDLIVSVESAPAVSETNPLENTDGNVLPQISDNTVTEHLDTEMLEIKVEEIEECVDNSELIEDLPNEVECLDDETALVASNTDVQNSQQVLDSSQASAKFNFQIALRTPTKMFVCTYCDYSSKYQKVLMRHMKRKHEGSAMSSKRKSKLPLESTSGDHSEVPTNENIAEICDDSSSHVIEELQSDQSCVVVQDTATEPQQKCIMIYPVANPSTASENDNDMKNTHFCFWCSSVFSNQQMLWNHCATKHDVWYFSCDHCGRLFTHLSELSVHMVGKHKLSVAGNLSMLRDPVVKSYACVVCPCRYRSLSDHVNHVAKTHNMQLEMLKCPLCGDNFLTTSLLKHHVQKIHDKNGEFHCELCGKHFMNMEKKETHVKQHSAELCTTCGLRLGEKNAVGKVSECKPCTLEKLNGSGDRVPLNKRRVAILPKSFKFSCTRRNCLWKYTCPTCGEYFANLGTFNMHKLKCKKTALTENYRAECPNCHRKFRTNLKLYFHLTKKPWKDRQFKCHVCGMQTPFRASLRRHYGTNHPGVDYMAGDSQNSSQTAGSDQLPSDSTDKSDHVSQSEEANNNGCESAESNNVPHQSDEQCTTHAAAKQKVVKKKICPQVPKYKFDISNGKIYVGCFVCNQLFRSKAAYEEHVNEVHGTETGLEISRSSAVCRHCNQEFFSDKLCRRHMASCSGSISDELILPFLCGKCSRRFRNWHNLSRHLHAHRRVPPSEQQIHLCSSCGYRTPSRTLLRKHEVRHQIVSKEFKCSHCRKEFVSLLCLNQHVDRVHSGRQIVCEHCGHRMRNIQTFQHHMRYHHPMPGHEPKYSCPICNRRFWAEIFLTNHMTIHDSQRMSIRKAKCAICAVLFRHVTNLTHHIKMAHSDVICHRPYACASCREVFESAFGFKKHYRSKHRNR